MFKISLRYQHLFFIFWPVRINFDFFLHYRSAIKEITFNKNGSFKKQLQILSLFTKIRISQQLFAFFFDRYLNIEQRIALFDYIYFLRLPVEIKLIFAMLLIMCEFILRKFYQFKGALFLCDFIVFPVIFNKNTKYLLIPKSQKDVKLQRIFTITKLYLYVFQLIVTSFVLWYAIQEFTLYWAAKTFLDSSKMTYNVVLLILAHLSYTLDIINSFILSGALHLVSSYLLLLTLIFFTRLNVLNERFSLMSYLNRNFFGLSKAHVLTLVHVCFLNSTYKRVLFALIGIGTPTNTYFLVALFTKKLSTTTVLFFNAIFISQVLAIFCFHLFLALYSAKLHAHWRPLLRWYVRKSCAPNRPLFSLYDQLQVSRKLETFLVRSKKQYGITYGSVYLISISSFAKVR